MSANLLRLTRILPADPRRVFHAWRSAEAMSSWFVCNSEWTPKATNDFRIGGKYRIDMCCGDRTVGVAFGEYTEIDPPRRLAFTWTSEGRVAVRNSLVTIELKAIGAHTELTLTHDLAPETIEGRAHAEGWGGALMNLDRYLQAEP